jgi:hypothetical protein
MFSPNPLFTYTPQVLQLATDAHGAGQLEYVAWRRPGTTLAVVRDAAAASSASGVVWPRGCRDVDAGAVALAEPGAFSLVLAGGAVAEAQQAADPHPERLLKRTLAAHVAAALAVLAPGGTLVLRVHDMHTRFTAGLYLLLHRCFARVRVVKPWSSLPLLGERFVVCARFAGPQDPVAAAGLAHLQRVLAVLAEAPAAGAADLLALAPMAGLLHDTTFFASLTLTNERLLAREVAATRAMLDAAAAPATLLPPPLDGAEAWRRAGFPARLDEVA